MPPTIGQRHTVLAWWLFYRQDSVDPAKVTPEMIESWIDEAEDDLRGCDKILQAQYEEYVPQF